MAGGELSWSAVNYHGVRWIIMDTSNLEPGSGDIQNGTNTGKYRTLHAHFPRPESSSSLSFL